MNNLPAEHVLFAFAKPAGEDYLFRLMNPGTAAAGWRIDALGPAAETIIPAGRGNRATMIRGIRSSDDHEMVTIVLRGRV